MVKVEPSDAISEIAAKHPESIPCFERWHLDYSSRGDRSLAVACEEEGIEFERLADDLLGSPSDAAPEVDWSTRPVTELTNHLIEHYHEPSRARLAAMEGLVMRIVAEQGPDKGQFGQLQRLLRALRDDLFPHMLKEETTLFPWVERLSEIEPGGSIERPFFGTIRNPMNMMSLEHGYVVELLGELRQLTDGFRPPEEADANVRDLYGLLEEFDQHQKLHVHLENNVLFPRAIEMEERVTILPKGEGD